MDDLSILPADVRKHVENMDARNTVNGSWNACRDELLRLAREVKRREGVETNHLGMIARADCKCRDLEAELATARETIKRLNRRVQVAEAGVAEKVKESSGRNLGRALANAAFEMMKGELDKAQAELEALKRRIAEAAIGTPVEIDFETMNLVLNVSRDFKTDGRAYSLLPVGGE